MKKIKKVLLFNPPAITFKDRIDINPMPPLGLGYLAAVLEKKGIEVKIIDALIEGWDTRVSVSEDSIRIGLPFETIEAITSDYKPDIVGVNNLFTKQRKCAHKIYEIAKKIDQATITLAGGAHPTVMPELVLADEFVDYVVLGEGERTLLDLIACIEGNQDFSTLDGVGYKDKGVVKVIPKKRFIEDLDALPFPAWHLLSMEKYFGLKSSHGERRKKRFAPVITSRGCPAQCTFCSAYAVWGRAFRTRSPENVLRELSFLKTQYGIEEIMFEDDNLTLDPSRAYNIFEGMCRDKLGLVWDTPNGIAAWTLNESLINKMKQSGCHSLNFALESGSQKVLNTIIKKPLDLKKVSPLVRYAKKIGLRIGIFLVVGMPYETQEQIWESFRFSASLGVFTPHISIATPYPGSELFKLCKEKGFLRPDFSLDDLYIRSFSISTEVMDGTKLKKILAEGQRFLLLTFLKKDPLGFIAVVISKLLKDPGYFLKKIFNFISRKDWSKVR
ncbi:MAG: cobalamin-dependent protein [Candidatus Omnitrophota bacterium]|jgi:magnesium-protoporphyrin IX monomethyl ester (oxidative) cyclase